MEKKKLWIFVAIAYGVTALMSVVMFIGFKKQYDITSFANVQMMYPACGVILGKLITKKEDDKLPMAGYMTVLITTAILMLMAVLSVAVHIEPLEMAGMSLDIWTLASQFPLIAGSLVCYILFWTCGKEKRENAGIERHNIKLSVIMVAVFIALFIGRCMIAVFLGDYMSGTDESLQQVLTALSSPMTWITLVVLPINFVMSFIAFFGEEYGWRYYLQPVMQGRFGKRTGVLLLGLVWAIWHIGIDFMFYTREYGPQAFICQIITCVAIAIFFGYAYMKTDNIWVPMIMHYLNNNLAAILGGGGNQALQNQVIEWKTVPVVAASYVMFVLFILAPVYGRSAKTDEVV